MVAEDTSWNASIDARNPVEKASELPQKKEETISQGSSTSEYAKRVEDPSLLTAISNILEIVKAIFACHPQVLEIANSNILEMMKAMSDCHPLQLDHTIKKSHNKDPLFLATESNNLEIVFRILIKHPQALEYTNKEGMNILHVAILHRRIEIFDALVGEFGVLSRRLLSAIDNKGNSLLHMVGQNRIGQVSEKMQSPALQLRKELLLFEVKF